MHTWVVLFSGHTNLSILLKRHFDPVTYWLIYSDFLCDRICVDCLSHSSYVCNLFF
ncbi:unnamed protein product, partial [Schistosoma bovis]